MVREEIIVRDFLELVQTDVQSKDERKIADKLIGKLEALGLEVTEDHTGNLIGGTAGNIIAKLNGKAKAPTILLSAHMDRVNHGTSIKPIIHNDRITSDGTTILAADNVAGLVSIIDGIRKIKMEKLPHGNIEVVFSVSEEVGITGSKYLDYTQLDSKIGFVLDSPGRVGRIINQAPAKKKITWHVYGKSAHAGNEPEKGINAIKVAAEALTVLKEGRINPHTTANFGVICGGSATNVVCDYVKVVGESRSTNNDDLDKYVTYLKETLTEVSKKFNTKISIDIEDSYDSFYIEENRPVNYILKRAIEAINGTCQFDKGGGGMDANRFNVMGIEAVGVATGYTRNHTFEEEIIISDLIQAGELVKNIILEAFNQKILN